MIAWTLNPCSRVRLSGSPPIESGENMVSAGSVYEVINKAVDGIPLEKNEIIQLLSISDQEEHEALYKAARETREKIFANKIFLYGFVYFSNWCRNDCQFCYYRKSNDIVRYRKDPVEIMDVVGRMADSGVHLIDLTMGEDLLVHQDHFKSVLSLIQEVKKTTDLPVMISPGVVEPGLIDQFAEMGVEWYALYQETHNRALFEKLRINQSYDERMKAKCYAKEKGMLIEEGILAGAGETLEDIADSMLEMGRIGAAQMRVMSFVPQQGSPMENRETPERELELKIIGILRLMYPGALIPASLDVEGIDGLKVRMNAGANLITSIIPPHSGLMGVAQNSMDVDEGGRTVEEAAVILAEMGLEPATAAAYRRYIGR